MKYQYSVYAPGSSEDVIATCSLDAPLPHIQVGHFLTVESHNWSTNLKNSLEIRRVEVLVSLDKDDRIGLLKTMVWTIERARTL